MRTKTACVVVAVLACSTMTALPASAEWFADFYLGGAFTSSHDLTTRFGATVEIRNDVELDDSFVFGGRVGYWFATPIYRDLSLGLALDVFRFAPDIDAQTVPGTEIVGGVADPEVFVVFPFDVSVTALSFDLMLRWPLLKSPEFPRGQLQPYFSIGPAIFFANAEDSINFTPARQSDSDTTVGLKLGAGVAWHVLKNLAVFGEFRFTHFSPEWDFTDGGRPGTLETDVNTRYFLVGVSYRF